MKTISQAVSEYIKSKPFLSSALSDGIINFTSLSRKIKPEIEEMLRKNVNNGAIVMALNRLSLNLEFQHTQKIKRVIKKIEEVSDLNNKKVILRLDLNVPLNGSEITDPTRIDKILPTLKFLIHKNSKIIIILLFFLINYCII